MKELNLTRANPGIYNINRYPDGQQDIELNEEYFSYTEKVKILSRMRSWLDIELIICATAALERLEVQSVELYIPYLLGARCDRLFKKGGTNYLRDVMSNIINAQGYSKVSVLDVHNVAVSDSCINKLNPIDNSDLVNWALDDIQEPYVLVCPDEGAGKKIYPLLDQIGYKDEVVICSKKRVNGRVVDTNINNLVNCEGKAVVIIDDICDGGRTFIEIAKKSELLLNGTNRYLIVSHGIFSAGYEELGEYFNRIYCTNSVSDTHHPLIKQMQVI